MAGIDIFAEPSIYECILVYALAIPACVYRDVEKTNTSCNSTEVVVSDRVVTANGKMVNKLVGCSLN